MCTLHNWWPPLIGSPQAIIHRLSNCQSSLHGTILNNTPNHQLLEYIIFYHMNPPVVQQPPNISSDGFLNVTLPVAIDTSYLFELDWIVFIHYMYYSCNRWCRQSFCWKYMMEQTPLCKITQCIIHIHSYIQLLRTVSGSFSYTCSSFANILLSN